MLVDFFVFACLFVRIRSLPRSQPSQDRLELQTGFQNLDDRSGELDQRFEPRSDQPSLVATVLNCDEECCFPLTMRIGKTITVGEGREKNPAFGEAECRSKVRGASESIGGPDPRRRRDDSWNKRKGECVWGAYSYIEESSRAVIRWVNPLAIPALA